MHRLFLIYLIFYYMFSAESRVDQDKKRKENTSSKGKKGTKAQEESARKDEKRRKLNCEAKAKKAESVKASKEALLKKGYNKQNSLKHLHIHHADQLSQV